MANLYLSIAFIIVIIPEATCDLRYIHRRIYQLKNRSRELYGEETIEDTTLYVNGYELNYPRGDKHKLVRITKLWYNYYECLARSTYTLTAPRQLPSAILMVYSGAVARLHCGLCVGPDEGRALTWSYAQSITNLTFFPMQDKDTTVWQEDGNMTMYQVTAEDTGVYRCQVGRSLGGLVVLEVVDNEEYTVVKPPSARGPHASPPVTLDNGLTVFSAWTQWSECSACGKVGRRRRYGLCYVTLHRPTLKNTTTKIGKIDNEANKKILDNTTLMLFETFPGGIPCRSRHLPRAVRRIPAVLHRRSEIMIAMCKVKCKNKIFELRSETGEVLERANNTARVYSLSQTVPKQPPLPARDTLFADYGQPFVIRCPGTTLRDVPVSWRAGARDMSPRRLRAASAGRLHLDARDHLVFTRVLYADTNLYSCWREGVLAGSVQLAVWTGGRVQCSQHAALAMLVLLAAAALRAARRATNKHHGRT